MPPHKDSNMLLQKYATSRETRSSKSLQKNVYDGYTQNDSNHYQSPQNKKGIQFQSSAHTMSDNDVSEGDGDPSSNGGSDIGDDEAEEDDDEPEGFALSGMTTVSEGLQTGHQSSSPMKRTGGTKRFRSPTSDEEVESSRRPIKSPRSRRTVDSLHTNMATDDDDYNGVDLISDSDEEEPKLEQLEERLIIDSEEENFDDFLAHASLFKSPTSSSDDWDGFPMDGNLLADVKAFDEEIVRTQTLHITESFDSTPLARRQSFSTPTPGRRVRFADDLPDLAGPIFATSSTSNSDFFPDLFMQQDSLDPDFRRMIENDLDEDGHSATGLGTPFQAKFKHSHSQLQKSGVDDDETSDGGSSSGYETDQGETTDEEVLPPQTVNRPQSLLRLNSATQVRSSVAPRGSITPNRRSMVTPSPAARRRGPSLASWVVDPTKPIAVVDSTGKTMLIYPAPRSVRANTPKDFINSLNSSTTVSPRTSFLGFEDSENDHSEPSSQDQGTTMLRNTPNVMMGGLLHGAPGIESILSGQVLGPPEAFYPFTSIDANGMIMDDDDDIDDEDDDDEDDPEDMLNIQDFIDFGDDSSDDDQQMADDSDSTVQPNAGLDSSPLTKIMLGKSSSSQDLLDHLDRGVVSSFRRNQQAHLRRPHPSAMLKSPYGIKGGRQFAASSPFNPTRKTKSGHGLSSSMSLLSGITTRRKVANRVHKRSKSAN